MCHLCTTDIKGQRDDTTALVGRVGKICVSEADEGNSERSFVFDLGFHRMETTRGLRREICKQTSGRIPYAKRCQDPHRVRDVSSLNAFNLTALLTILRTETGIISTIFRGTSSFPSQRTQAPTTRDTASDDEDWEYFEINSHVNCKLLPNNDLEQSYRLVVTVCFTAAISRSARLPHILVHIRRDPRSRFLWPTASLMGKMRMSLGTRSSRIHTSPATGGCLAGSMIRSCCPPERLYVPLRTFETAR